MATILTIGHGDRQFPALLDVLRRNGAATIIDVRSQPYSRHAPDFAKQHLQGWCAVSGLGYRWMGRHLGGMLQDPDALDDSGVLDAAALTSTAGFQAAIDTVATVAAGGRAVLLCAEEDPAHCHRSRVLAPAFIARGHQVLHLRHDGTAQGHQDELRLE